MKRTNQKHGGRAPERLRRVAALCLLLGLVLGLLPGCGRRSSASVRIDNNRRWGAVSSVPSEDVPATQAPAPEPTPTVLPEQTEASTDGGLVYSDTRVPHYTASTPVWETLRFDWTCQDGGSTARIEVQLDVEMYRHYRSLERYYGVENFHQYVNDENNRAFIQSIVRAFQDVASDLYYDDAAVAREIAKFVQDCIVYQYDSDTSGQDEYPRYPIETLYERQGDCEDTSILMAALLKEWGYEVGFLQLPGHVAVAIRTSDDYNSGAYYQIGDHRYLFIESTGSGWNIGDIPPEWQSTEVRFYPLA